MKHRQNMGQTYATSGHVSLDRGNVPNSRTFTAQALENLGSLFVALCGRFILGLTLQVACILIHRNLIVPPDPFSQFTI